MPQIAELILRAKSDELRRAKGDLDDLRASGAKTEKGITDSTSRMSKGFTGAAAAAGKMAAAATAALAATAGIGAAIGVIREFESSMSQVAAITRANTVELAAMRDVAKELGSTTEFTASQAADGLRFLGMAGFDAAESIAAIPAVLDLATASAMGLAASADISSNVLSGFGLAAGDAAQVADVLAAASSRSNTSVAQLGGAMSTVAPIAAALDISLQDTAAAIGVMSDAGIQGERAGTALRGVLASLAGPTDAAVAALSKYGLTAAQVNPEAHSLSEIFELLRKRGLSTADAMEIFGREAASGALVLADASGRIGEFGEELRAAEGAASEMAGTMRDNLAGDANTLISAMQGLAVTIGEAGLTAALRSVVKGITAFVNVISGGIGFITKFTSELVTVGSTTDQMNAAIFSVNGQIAGELALMAELFGELPAGTRLTRETAKAKLDQANAIRARILQGQAELEQVARESQAYKQLENHMAAIQQLVLDAEQDRATNAGTLVEPLISDVALQELRDALAQTKAEMTKLVISAGQLPPEYAAATARMEQLQAALDAAGDGMVVIKDEAEQSASVAGRLNAILASLPGYISQAATNTNALTRGLGGAARAGLSVFNAIRSVVALLGPLGVGLTKLSGLASMASKATGAVGKLLGTAINSNAMKAGIKHLRDAGANLTLMAGNAVTAKIAMDDLESASSGAGGSAAAATQSAIEKLKQQIEQERALLGLSDEAKMQLEARHEVERALAADKAVWNEAEIAALTNQIVLTKKLGEQAQKAARVTDLIFDGIAKGDIGSIGSGLLSQAQSGFSDLLKTASGHAGGFFAGLKSGFSDAISGIGSALSGTGSLFAKLGGAISSAMPIIGAISAAFSFFKKTVRNLDVGLKVAGEGMEDLIAQTYKLDEVTRFWGLSKKERKTYETASAELADPIQAAVNRIGQSVMDLSETLGLASENVASTAFEFEISTKGLSDEQIQSAIAAEMERLGDTFANAVIGSYTEFLPDEAEIARIEKQIAGTFNIGGRGGEDRGAMERAQLEQQKVAAQTAIEVVHLNEAFAELVREGGGSYDTLVALVGSLELVNSSFSDLGFALFDTALAGANAARVFADAVGGWDAFSEKMSFFVDTFYSDSEKLEIVTGRIHDAFAGLDPNNISTAMHSRDQFKELADWAGSGAAVNEDQADLFAALINAAPLIDQMFSLQEAIAAAGNAVDGTTDQIDQFNSIASEREQLERQLLQLQGDTAGLRALELQQVNEANRSILEQIHNLEDQQEAQRAADEAAAQAARDAEALASQRASMEAEILRLEGNTVALRQIELNALDSSLVPLQERIYQLQDEAEASAEAKRVADELTRQQEAAARERSTLETELLRLQGDTAALRSLELAALDPANRELQERIWKLTDEQAALAAIEAAANERIGLERRLLQLQGDTAALRERELAELDPTNRALLERIFALEDLQDAEADQARLDQEAATVAKAIADQRTQMTKQLLNLEGDVAGVRALELAALDPSLHALQKRTWGLEDEAEATEAARAAAEKAAGERDSLEVRTLELQGNTAALRARELAALEPVNRALQEYVWGLEAENEAREKANQLAEEQSSEKYGLHTRLLELLGDTDQLRARELELLFPANRALQEQIWALEDATEASDSFTAKLEQMRSEMRDALSMVERLIGAEINAIQSTAQARIEALQSEIDMARDLANVARDTLQGAFDVVRASIDADRTMVVAGYTAAIERLDSRMEAATTNVDRLRGVFDLLDGALAGRALGGPRREQARFMEAQSYIRGLSGVPSDTGALEAAVQALSGDGERFYGNSTDFEFDFLRTNAALSNLRGQAGNQLSDAERQVAAIEGARVAREAQHEREMARLDDQLAIAQGIYDEALGNTINLVDVGTGIAGLRSAADLYTSLADQLLATEATAGAEIEAIGAAADMQIGLLEDQLSAARKSVEIAEGTYESIETIQAAIDHLNQTITAFSEANDQVGSKFASDTTEAIISAPAEVNDLRNENSKENARLLEQNRLLTEEVRELRDDMNQLLKAISSNTKTTANLQQKFDVEGIKERTT
jgi:TP901 family phage tail tape measure protein